MSNSTEQNVKDSFLYHNQEQKGMMKWLQKFDFFSFIPVPKDEPVSTNRSIIGSTIFIILFLIYMGIDLFQFIVDNPPLVQNALSKLDNNNYTLPRVAITFMDGQNLDNPLINDTIFTWKSTKELKDNSIKQQTNVLLNLNDYSYLSGWMNEKTTKFYSKLISPAQELTAKGLLYSTQNSNYSKISISMCNLNNLTNQCETQKQIKSRMAKGRVFLFIQQIQDESGVFKTSQQGAPFRIANFFLMPRIYKRVTIEYQVIKTTVLPDYFHRFTTKQLTRLQLSTITQSVSDVSINDEERERVPLNMLGINFQLSAQSLNVRVAYITFLDHVSKWGAFFNLLFSIFAIYFFAYNKNKFYKKNPDWDKFKGKIKNETIYSNPNIDIQNDVK